MSDETSKQVSGMVFSVLSAICIGLSSFALKWSFDANAEMRAMAVEMKNMGVQMEKMTQKTELDAKQDAQISKFWRLHSWARSEVNKIRVKNGDGIAEWPELGDWD